MIKLATIPSGYKTSKLYSVVPNDGLGDFTFVRTTEATRINEDGLIETLDANIPRLDYSKSGCPELLMERASTNLITYSEDFSGWINTFSTDTFGAISPSGLANATTLTDDGNGGASGNVRIQKNGISINATTVYTFSCFLKPNPNNIVEIKTANDDAIRGGTFDLSTKTFTPLNSETGNIELISNDWYKVYVTWTSGSDTSIALRVGFPNITRDGTNSFILWGTQLEQSTKATSYIPSLLGTATTRAIDRITDLTTIDVTSDDWTLFINADYTDLNFSFGCISINDGDDDNNLRIMNIESSEEVRVTNRVGGSGVNNYNIFYGTWGYKLKIGIVSTSNGIDIYVNGQLASSQTSGRIDMSGMTNIGFTDGSGDNFLGRISDFRYYNTNLSNDDIIKLTE